MPSIDVYSSQEFVNLTVFVEFLCVRTSSGVTGLLGTTLVIVYINNRIPK